MKTKVIRLQEAEDILCDVLGSLEIGTIAEVNATQETAPVTATLEAITSELKNLWLCECDLEHCLACTVAGLYKLADVSGGPVAVGNDPSDVSDNVSDAKTAEHVEKQGTSLTGECHRPQLALDNGVLLALGIKAEVDLRPRFK